MNQVIDINGNKKNVLKYHTFVSMYRIFMSKKKKEIIFYCGLLKILFLTFRFINSSNNISSWIYWNLQRN